MLLRLLTTGACFACVVILATFEPVHLEVTPDLKSYGPCMTPMASPIDRSAVSVLEVAHGVAPDELASLVRLRPAEWVSAINDRPLDPDIPVGHLIASLAPHAGEFLDLTVSSATTERRVLVLMH